METLDKLKDKWGQTQDTLTTPQSYDQASFEKIVKSRVNSNMTAAIRYFWASLAFQILVYSLLTHVMVKYWSDTSMLLLGIGGILLFLPFTIVLMKKFKRIATLKPADSEDRNNSLQHFVLGHYSHLLSFYRFKKRYELMLIPLSSIIGIVLTFTLYVPGGVAGHPTGALITFFITLLSCGLAIRSENKKSFEAPMQQLRQIMDEFKTEA